jgi:hypothetical protein
VECAVPAGWDDTQDRGYARECIGEPEKGQTWHQHCLEHVNQQMAELHQGLDKVIRHLASEGTKDYVLLETLTAEDKLIAVRKLVAAHATETELMAEQQARLRDSDQPLRIDQFLWQTDEALDMCEQALALCSRVLVHAVIYGEDTWLVELTRASDWIGTALADLRDALPMDR